MELWRVLDLYKRDASRRGQAPAKQTLWTRIKRSTLESERNGAFAAKPLGESPRNSSHGGIFWVSFLLYLPSISRSVLFRAAFSCAVLFYYRKNHFSVLFEYNFTPWKHQKSTQNLLQPIHAFSLSRHKTVCNCYGQSDTNFSLRTTKRIKLRHANNRKTQIKPEFLQKKNLNQTLSYSI